jgi:hypothetical protein
MIWEKMGKIGENHRKIWDCSYNIFGKYRTIIGKNWKIQN